MSCAAGKSAPYDMSITDGLRCATRSATRIRIYFDRIGSHATSKSTMKTWSLCQCLHSMPNGIKDFGRRWENMTKKEWSSKYLKETVKQGKKVGRSLAGNERGNKYKALK